MTQRRFPAIGFVALSGSGKTTLLRGVAAALRSRGLRLGYLKHAHHSFDLDRPGKDSFLLREAGAEQTLLASRGRWALQVERPTGRDPGLADMLARFDGDALDLVLVEGFKHAAYPKIEVYRPSLGHPPLYPDDPDILAVATDAPLPPGARPVRLPLADPEAVAEFVLARLRAGALHAAAEP